MQTRAILEKYPSPRLAQIWISEMTEEASFPPYRRTGDGLESVFILCFFPGTAENTTFANLMSDIKRLMISSEIGFPFNCHSYIITYPEAGPFIMVNASPNVRTVYPHIMTLTYRSMITCGPMSNAEQPFSSPEG